MKRGRQSDGIVYLKPEMSTGRMVGWIIRITLLVILLIALVWSQNNLLVTNTYVYQNQKIGKSFVGYKIVHLSDLHNTSIGIVNKVKAADPDLILVTGGYANDKGDYSRSAKVLQKLSDVAPTYYVLGDGDTSDFAAAVGNGPQLIEDGVVDIPAPQVDADKFIKKYVKNKIIQMAEQGDQKASDYITYIKDAIAESSTVPMRVFGVPYGADQLSLNDRVYSLIGTERDYFTVCIANQTSLFNALSKMDIDLMLSGETHGKEGIVEGYKSGLYSQKGTDIFVSRGIGNLKSYGTRIFDYPQLSVIVLSDGTLKQENPIEKILGNFIYDVDTIFSNDKGFTTKYEEYDKDEYAPYRKS